MPEKINGKMYWNSYEVDTLLKEKEDMRIRMEFKYKDYIETLLTKITESIIKDKDINITMNYNSANEDRAAENHQPQASQ